MNLRVFAKMHIIARRKIGSEMGSPAFLTCQCRVDD